MMLIVQVFYALQVCSVIEQMEEMTCIKKINSLCEYYDRGLELTEIEVKFCLSCMMPISLRFIMIHQWKKLMKIVSTNNFKPLSQIITMLIMTHQVGY